MCRWRRVGAWLCPCALVLGCSTRDLGYLSDGHTDLPELCPQGGWCLLADTRLQDVCPPNNAQDPLYDTCHEVVDGNNSAVLDTARQRLLLWGQGTQYRGNEIYALSLLDPPTMARLDDPSLAPACDSLSPGNGSMLPDGRPFPRETHDSLALLADQDRMLVVNSSTACGYFEETWTLGLAQLDWVRQAPEGPAGCDADGTGTCHPGGYIVGISADYDPVTKTALVLSPDALWQYFPGEDRYARLTIHQGAGHTMTGRVDPDRRLFVIMGCDASGGLPCAPTLRAISLEPEQLYPELDWLGEQQGCDELLVADGPGLAYDSKRHLFVGWPNQGNRVYLFDPDTRQCTVETYDGGPQVAAEPPPRTFGRFRYMPAFDAFVLVYDSARSAMVLRLR